MGQVLGGKPEGSPRQCHEDRSSSGAKTSAGMILRLAGDDGKRTSKQEGILNRGLGE